MKLAELALTGPVFDPARRKDRLRFLIAVTGTDGHRALLSWAEIDPDFADAPVLPAVTMEDRAPARRDARARRGWRRAPGPPRPPWPRHCIGFITLPASAACTQRRMRISPVPGATAPGISAR